MTTQYVMIGFHTVLNKHVYWYSLNSPDFTGTYSGYTPSDLTSITVDYSVTVPNNVGIGNLNLLTGPQGGPGPSTISVQVSLTSATVPAGYVVQEDTINKIKLATTSVTKNRFVGVVLSTTAAGGVANLQIHGPLDVNVMNLGAGARCAVGINSGGAPVRATDAFCISGLNYIGWCDENGSIYIDPRIAENFNVMDFGARGDGSTNDATAISSAISKASSYGGEIFFPASGSYYKVTSAITLPSNIRLVGEHSQRGPSTSVGSVIAFQGSGSGFIMNGTDIGIEHLILWTDGAAGPHISQPTAASAFGYWRIHDVAINCGNPNKGAIVLGSSADGYGVQNNWSTFERVDIVSGASQAVPVIQLYGQGGGFNNMSIRDCVITGGGLVGSGTESLAEFIHIQSTDAGIITNIELHNISFEIPVRGAIVLKSVWSSKITNCWAGDLTGHNPQAPLILIDKSPNTGTQISQDILIDTLFTDIGTTTVNQESINIASTTQAVTVTNCRIMSIRNNSTTPVITVGTTIQNAPAGAFAPLVGPDPSGFSHARTHLLAPSTIILQNGLNSNITPSDIYTGFARVTSTAIAPVSLGGLTLGYYGSYFSEAIEFTLYYNHNQPLTLVHEDLSSTAAYRINTPTGQNIEVGTNSLIRLLYDNNSNRWLVSGVYSQGSAPGIINIKDYGAKGDGVTDDTTAIQAALNALQYKGGTIFFPIGIYMISSGIQIGVGYDNIFMVGAGSRFSDYRTGSVIRLSNSSSYLLQISTLGSKFEKIWFDGYGNAGSVIQLIAQSVPGPGVSTRCTENEFSDCTISGAVNSTGFEIEFAGDFEVDMTYFYRCEITHDTHGGGTHSAACVRNHNGQAFMIDFDDCVIRGGALIADIRAGSCNFYGCEIFDWTTSAIQVEATQPMNIHNCYTEGTNLPWFSMTNVAGVNGTTPITLKHNQINAFCTININNKQPVILEENYVSSNININPAPTYGIYPVIASSNSFNNGSTFVNSGPSNLLVSSLNVYNNTVITQTDWYVDFVNGNDGYPGTISQPVKTVMGGVVSKWGTSSPILSQTTKIHILNSQTLGAEKIVLSPTMLNTSLFEIIGTPAANGTTFALGTVTAKNISSKQVLKANGFTGKTQGQLVVNTTRSNSRALILSVVGGTATLTQPMAAFVPGTDTNYFPTPTLYDTWTAGDTIQVYDLPKLNLIDISCFGTEDNVAYSGGDALILQNLYIPDQSGSPGSAYFGPRYQNGIITMDGCVIEPFGQTANKTPNVNCLNTMWLYGGEFELTYFAGGAVTSAGGVVYTGINWLDGYTMIDTTAASSCVPLYCGWVSFTSGSQLILHPNSSMEIRQMWYPGAQGGAVFGDGYLHLQPNSSCTRRTPTPSWVSCLNLTTLTFPSGATTGTSYSAGTFTDGRALTSANLDTYGGLQDPKTGAIFANDL